MASRRAVGEGSVYRRRDKEGKEIKDAWVAQIAVDGKRKTFTGKTRKEATAKLDEYKKSAEFLLPTVGAEMKLEDFMKEWMTSVKRRTLKDTSYDRLECTVINNIVPCIGSYKINELTYGIIQNEVINRLQDDGKSYSTIKKAYNALNESMKYAIFPKEIIVKNPMLGVVMPSPEQFDTKEIRYLIEEEIARFKNAATATWGNGKPIYPLGYAMILTLNTGVRVGEALAWRWSDYDETGGILHTNGTLVRVRDRTEGERRWKQQFQTTKTKNGKRSIPVNAAAKTALNELKKTRYFGKDSPILAQADGTFNTIDNFTRTFEAILKRANIRPCGIHTLRHTFATQLIAKNTDVKIVSSLLGHSSVEITYNIYVHALEETTKKAVATLCNI